MSKCNLEELEVDRLSELPEPLLLHILSFLPTKFAVRTSLLARCFRHLWTASPSMELDRSDFPSSHLFYGVTYRCLLLRDPSAPLLNFCLKTKFYMGLTRPLSIKVISNWLIRAHSLGMRSLSLKIHRVTIESLFPLILSFGSLYSLCISCVDMYLRFPPLVPPTFPLIQLKHLNIRTVISGSGLKTFIMEQTNLEYFCIEALNSCSVDLSSQSVKILKLSSNKWKSSKICLSFPKLEYLDLSISVDMEMNQFHGEMPVLRKALVYLGRLREQRVPVLRDILKSITNVSDLTLHIGSIGMPYTKLIPAATRLRKLTSFDLFHPLVEPGKDMLMFPNLRSLKLSMCFYENALEDLICLLHHSPVIDSLHLIHVEGPSNYQPYLWARNVWHSKLPLNSEGNRKYADFSNIQTGDKKSEVIKLLSGEKSSKRLKT